MTDDQRGVRLEKLHAMRDAGMLPYADRFAATHRLTQARGLAEAQADSDPATGAEVRVCGRILTWRAFGKLTFLHLQDGSGRCQVAFNAKDMAAETLEAFGRYVDLGDHIGVRGRLGRTQKGEPTVFAAEWTFLSKTLRPLPDKWHGLTDPETRQRDRYLDLLTNPETRERFRFRSRFVRELRRFLDDHDFEEVDTPILQTKKSGALARPFLTHHNALDMPCVLRIAPETWLKQCVAGGMDRVYEVARCFRNEGMDPSHLQDFTMCEWYAAYWDYHDNMDFTERLVLHLMDTLKGDRTIRYGDREISFAPPWPRVSFRDLILKDCGLDFEEYEKADALRAAIKAKGIHLERGDDELASVGRGTLIDLLYKKVSRPKLIDPTFVLGHPIDLSPLARRSDDDPQKTDRYQLVVNTWEVVNAYSELVDPIDQRGRFEDQARAGDSGDDEALEVDEDYLRCMEHGMPPMSGWGMGIERFVALLTGQDNLRDVVLFPLMKPIQPGAAAAETEDAVVTPRVAARPDAANNDAPREGGGLEVMSDAHRALLGSPADDVEDLGITTERAHALFDEWVKTESLRRQMTMASWVMAALARRDDAQEEAWRLIGLLHNLDFDRVKEPERHCLVAAEVFQKEGMHPAAIHAICAHNDDGLKDTGIRCISRLDHAVSCAEAVVGLIHAASQILPSKDVQELKLKSLVKKCKDKRFAANVERALIDRCEGLGLSREAFLELALTACQEESAKA